MKKIIIVIALFFCYKVSYTKDTTPELKLYKAARKQYLKENYEEAKDLFESLLDYEEIPELEAYILFYYALALYHCDESDEAIEFLQIVNHKYPEWYNIKEVWYWLGVFYFEKNQYELALESLNRVSGYEKSLDTDIKLIKFYSLDKCDDIGIIEDLFNRYPNDRSVAEVLINKLSQEPIYKRKVSLIERLAKDFDMYTEDIKAIQAMPSIKKDTYNIAVFLPFFVEKLQGDINADINFVLSLYEGIKLAAAELEDLGIKINLYAYDTHRDPTIIAGLLDKDEVKFMDAIIGPLYPEEIPLLSEFSKKFKIPMFNPLSDNLELVDNNPFCFLYQPSVQTKAISAAKYTLTTADVDTKIGVVYSKNKTEILAASLYKNYIEANSTHKVDVMIGIEPNDSSTFLSYYIKKNKNGISKSSYPYATIEGLTHIYVPSKDEIIAASIISAAEIVNNKINIIVDESWLYFESIALDQILGLKIVFISPFYIDYKKSNIYEFRTKFNKEFAIFPDSHAMKGYELTLFLGRMLNLYGTNFISELRKNITYDTNIFSQIRYGLHHDNQVVPLARVLKDEYVICYNNK